MSQIPKSHRLKIGIYPLYYIYRLRIYWATFCQEDGSTLALGDISGLRQKKIRFVGKLTFYFHFSCLQAHELMERFNFITQNVIVLCSFSTSQQEHLFWGEA